MIKLIKVLKLGLAVSICLIAFYLRTPFLANFRIWAFWGILTVSFALISFEIIRFVKQCNSFKKISNFLILTIACLGFSTAITLEVKFMFTKQFVLNQSSTKLEQLGQHFIVGYRDFDEVKGLVNKKAIGGVFITHRNITNKTKDEIQQEIKTLQDIRRKQGLFPLWIATDQEGGAVSRLSPPLTRLPQLSKIIDKNQKLEQNKEAVVKYARMQGKELAEIGVNLNFSPVVDLNKGIINPNDRFSKIYQRAISTDKEVVAKVASWYCQTLERSGVRCTLKHFPGLGRVNEDTHIAHAELSTPIDELTRDDWVPFREVIKNSQAFTMLAHARLTAVDSTYPVSFSKSVVTGIIRNNWSYEGILITDDFSMGAVYGSEGGIKGATVQALNAGVDLILVSFDGDLYYEAISALIDAEKAAKIDSEILEASRKRLMQAQKISFLN